MNRFLANATCTIALLKYSTKTGGRIIWAANRVAVCSRCKNKKNMMVALEMPREVASHPVMKRVSSFPITPR
jgi:hypothetical protein